MKNHCVLGLLGLSTLVFGSGCGGDEAASSGTPGTAGGSAGTGSGMGNGGNSGSSAFVGASGSAGEGGVSGVSGQGGSSGSGATAGAAGTATCTITSSSDVPDEDFQDANCDGIDGNATAAIFVAPEGSDDGEGTMAEPVQTLARAVAMAAESGRSIYVCNGTYSERLAIEHAVAIYGGYDCEHGWKRTKDRAVVEIESGVALSIRGVGHKVHLERMAFHTSVAKEPGASSQAGSVVDSSDVELVRVEFVTTDGVAGEPGRPGVHGNDPPNPPEPTTASASGKSSAMALCKSMNESVECATYAAGGFNVDAVQHCSNGFASRGGGGGRGGNVRLMTGVSCMSGSTDAGADGRAGEIFQNSLWYGVAPADLGKNGSSGSDGASATSGIGSVADGRYAASNSGKSGTDGTNGYPGRGGHGGLSMSGAGDICSTVYVPGSGGGQGGAGGCAGTHAEGGGAGGGSIGLLIIESTVQLSFPRFEIGDGGAGGDGAPGGTGKPGTMIAGPGWAYLMDQGPHLGKVGQFGGKGGDGGDGGAGAGGPSIAILYSGAVPTVSDADYTIGVPGNGGLSSSLGNAPVGVTGEIVNLDAPSN